MGMAFAGVRNLFGEQLLLGGRKSLECDAFDCLFQCRKLRRDDVAYNFAFRCFDIVLHIQNNGASVPVQHVSSVPKLSYVSG